jgi:pimeloyl-ACP methyl ester carboxylesterase
MRWLKSQTLFATRRRRWIVRLSVLLATYAVFIMYGGCVDRLILFPSTGREDALGATAKNVPFAGGKLQLWTSRSPGSGAPVAYVLHLGGNASRAEWCAAPVALDYGQHPVEVWALNYPGYGASEGQARLAQLGPAALAAFDAMAAEAQGRPILLHAESLGTAVALHLATQRPVAGLVLVNPPPLQNMIMERFGWWNAWLLAGPIAWNVPSELNSLLSAPTVKRPAVFVLAQHDEVVPPKYQQRVVDAYGGPRQTVQTSGGHNDGVDGAATANLRRAIDWLWQQSVEVATSRPEGPASE